MSELSDQFSTAPLDSAQDLQTPLDPAHADTRSFRSTAHDPNLRIARVEVFHVLSVDLGDLVDDHVGGLRALQRLRATDQLSAILRDTLIGSVSRCTSEAHSIRSRMTEAKRLRGKAVWSDGFVDRYSPILLPVRDRLVHNNSERQLGWRLSDDPNSPLHYVRFTRNSLKIFGDGTLTYTIAVDFLDRSSHREGGTAYPPASINEAIDRLLMLDQIMTDNFQWALADFLRPDDTRARIELAVQQGSGEHGFKLKDLESVEADSLKKRSKEHRVIFVENFYDDQIVRTILETRPGHGLESLSDARIDLQRVLESSSLAGLLNTATWYKTYNERYVRSLINKEIGYKNDEIYLTDRKSTVICCQGFWDEGRPGHQDADPLTRYKWDIVLSVEYCVSRLAYLSCVLGYYQDHPDVRNIENANVLDVLPRVIDGRAILSHITESLDLALLIDHGFTRLFAHRLSEELGLESAVRSIRQRVGDTSQSVDLKSSVLAAEHTSKDNLQAALRNNLIQKWVLIFAVATVIVAIALFVAGKIWP